MNKLGWIFAVGLAGALCLILWKDQTSVPVESGLPSTVENFRLADHQGRSHELFRFRDAPAVVLIYVGNGCPIARQTMPRIKELHETYREQGVEFFLINANPHDGPDSIAKEAADFAIDIPVLVDDTQLVTLALGTTRTAEALVVVPSEGWKIAYRGAVDDRFDYGQQQAEAKHNWLADALDSVLVGAPVQTAHTETKGCVIDLREPSAAASYAEDVAPIIQQKCVPCHQEGNVGPFALASHKDVDGWAPMMREVILTKRMPPWHADPHYGEFANDRGLSDDEANQLVSWLEAGAPRGSGPDPLAEASAADTATWRLGAPSMVVELSEPMEVPAEGVFDYEYIEVKSPVDRDVWLKAVDVQASNRRVVHHVLVFLEYPDHLKHLQPRYRGGLRGYFAGYVPGMDPYLFPEGTGKFLPAGSTFVFQMHFNATGREETDHTQMALYFHDEKPAIEIKTEAISAQRFKIPPGSADHAVEVSHTLESDKMLWSMSPHMHLRGSRFRYEASYPDGTHEVLLSVPNFDFAWQSLYRLPEPKRLPKGTTITCVGAFDNSARNPANPDATATVHFGEQTFDEMFIGYMNLSDAV